VPDARTFRIARIALAGLATLILSSPAAAAGSAPLDAARQVRSSRLARVRGALAVHARHVHELMSIPDVVGTGTGLDPDGEAVIRVFLARPRVTDVPASIEGVPVRPRVTGRLHALRGATCDIDGDAVCETFERWPLPVPIGVSVGHPAITAGTIGARTTNGSDVFALSNNHVLANANAASPGDATLQPGTYDGGSAAAGDEIGTLYDFEPIRFCEFPFLLCTQTNLFDAAIALSTTGELGFATPAGEFGSAPGYGAPSPVIHAAYGDPSVLGDEDLSQLQQLAVQKYGRTTGLTHGSIDTIQLTVDICYDPACDFVARFDDQLSIPGGFSGPGDSGSLVVTDDALRQPVALLFAGSDTQTIVSRIDRVLDRFAITIDDGGTSGPVADASLESLVTPPYVLTGATATVSVGVRNRGNEPLPSFDIELLDETEATTAVLTAPPLDPGAQAQLAFDWTPVQTGDHILVARLLLTDDDPSNDEKSRVVSVLMEPPGVSLRLWKGTVRTDAWTLVALNNVDYGTEMVPICTPLYDVVALGPMVARVRNASGSSFEVGLGRPWFGAFPGDDGSAEVQCMVVRAGVYDEPGFRMEAVRLDGFAAKDDSTSWAGQARAYAQAYLQPVVVGQVLSPAGSGAPGEIGVWSVFWARGATSLDPPSATQLFVGRHTAEDPTARSPESIAYVVIESGTGWLGVRPYVAALGVESIRGVDDAPPYVYPLAWTRNAATHAIASSAGMDGLEGGWPILYGADAVQAGELHLAIDEDWWWDPERSHTTEQVGYIVFAPRPYSCGNGGELVLLLPLLQAALAPPRRRRQ